MGGLAWSATDLWSEAEISLAERHWREGASVIDMVRALHGMGAQRTEGALRALMMRNPQRFPRRAPLKKTTGHLHAGNLRGKRAARELDPGYSPAVRLAEARAFDAASKRLPLAELAATQCRFPVNEAEPGDAHLFCGLPQARGCYCAHHAGRAFGGFFRAEAA
ncbi:GcrA family cell cycle regulator [Neoaquamicrobium sediminum]|uniref:GcrA family cell cycle regulator n=1 Tax=Neoaquamicrobium sediminum TaxID=1849104 RepID=UPI003BAC2A64